MANEISQRNEGDIVHARISKLMTLADQHALEAFAKKLIDGYRIEENQLEANRKVRLLITLEDFEGWEENAAWGDDLYFQFEYGEEVARIAIVGDAKWKEPALLFVGKGVRDTEIEFFPTDALAAAEAWVRR